MRGRQTQLDAIGRFDMPGFRPSAMYSGEMGRCYGILSKRLHADTAVNVLCHRPGVLAFAMVAAAKRLKPWVDEIRVHAPAPTTMCFPADNGGPAAFATRSCPTLRLPAVQP